MPPIEGYCYDPIVIKGPKPFISKNINTFKMGEAFLDLALIARHSAI